MEFQWGNGPILNIMLENDLNMIETLGDPWRPYLKMVILAILTIFRHGRQGLDSIAVSLFVNNETTILSNPTCHYWSHIG